MSRLRTFRLVAATTVALLSACAIQQPADTAEPQEREPAFLTRTAPPDAATGTCWSKTVTPAVIETVTEQVMVQPPETRPDGTGQSPAVFATETRQKIVRDRSEDWFQTPCADALTPDFIASLQRALKARGLYAGAVSGMMDARTRDAVRRLQEPQGIASGVLSIAAARQLGLVIDPRFARDGG